MDHPGHDQFKTTLAARPTRGDALAAFGIILDYIAGRADAEVNAYDQRPGHLPRDAKSADAFKRWHRRARAAGIPGVWVRGKLLCCTVEAWAEGRTKTRKAAKLPLVDAVPADSVEAALGIRVTRRAR